MSLEYLTGKMREFVKDRVMREFNIQMMTHALVCNKECGGDNEIPCEIRVFLLKYRDEYKELEE